MAMHDDEIEVDEQLVRRLLERDLPEAAALPLHRLAATGSTNALFRLGQDLLVRLPRQPGGSASIDAEARWLPVLAPAVPVAVPAVVASGGPGFGYPERWTVTRWIDGRHPATPVPQGAAADALALDLAGVVRALAAADVPAAAAQDDELRWYRGGPLAAVDEEIRDYLDQCRRVPGLDLDVDACAAIWAEAVAADAPTDVPHWLHGDLLAENLLVDDQGRLAAVLDFGALSVGDPAAELVVAWEVLPHDARMLLRSELDVADATWSRGRAWALAIAVMTFPYYWDSMPDRCRTRLVMARAVLADAAAG